MTKCEVNDENYEHVAIALKTFRMKNMEEYHNFYLKIDVLFLADFILWP